MAHCFVSLALLLLAIAGGMFLLAKTNKDNLGNLFRFVSWFIIVSGFLALFLCGLMCICSMCCHGGGMDRERMMMMHQGMMSNEECGGGEGSCNRQVIIKKFGNNGDMNCPGMHHGGCKEEGKCDLSSGSCCKEMKGGNCEMEMKGGNCCKEGNKECKMEMKKDTAIIKKK